MKGRHMALPLLAVAAACGEGNVDLATALMEARSGSALEQVLDVRASTQDGASSFTITSTLLNAGDQPLTVVVRSCYLRETDLRGDRAGLRLDQPLMLCAGDGHEITLAPGASSEPLVISGGTSPGRSHDLEVRHALQPEHWEPVTLHAP